MDITTLAARGWTTTDDGTAIQKTFVFRNFIDAFGFMTRAAFWAEKWNHHPEWSNSFKTVVVKFTTHDAGGLTEKDIKLATKMEELEGQ